MLPLSSLTLPQRNSECADTVKDYCLPAFQDHSIYFTYVLCGQGLLERGLNLGHHHTLVDVIVEYSHSYSASYPECQQKNLRSTEKSEEYYLQYSCYVAQYVPGGNDLVLITSSDNTTPKVADT